MGLILSFFFQFSLNAAVTMGMIPTTGINMPLFSYGGTSMITHLLSFGLVISALKGNLTSCKKLDKLMA